MAAISESRTTAFGRFLPFVRGNLRARTRAQGQDAGDGVFDAQLIL
jgi:hypothetical protein